MSNLNNVLGGQAVGTLPVFTVATLPSAAAYANRMVFVSDAAVTTGTGNLAYSDGTNWRRSDTGANVS